MNNITKIISGLLIVVIIGIVSTPIIYQKQVESYIEKNFNHNLKEISNKDSFIKLNREYIFTLTNMQQIISSKYPDMSKKTLNEIANITNGSKILIKLNFFKYPIYHKNAIEISLLSLNKKNIQTLSNSIEGTKLLNLIKQQAIKAFIDINNLKIAKIKLKDIDFQVNYTKKQKLKINFENFFIRIKNNKYDINLKKFIFINPNNKLKLTNFNYIKIKQNDFNLNDKLFIKNIIYSNFLNSLEIKNISEIMKISNIINNINIKSNIKISKLKISKITNPNKFIEINQIKLNYDLSKINFKSLKILINNPNNQEMKKNAIRNIISNGFKMEINPFSIKNANINIDKPIKISKFSISLKTKLNPNNFNKQILKANDILKQLEIDFNMITTPSNIDLISKFNPLIPIYLNSIIVRKKNNVFINLKYKNEHILSKGKILF